MSIKNRVRKFLGIEMDLERVQGNFEAVLEVQAETNRNVFELFHALPFSGGAMLLTAKDAARLTVPEGVSPNTLTAILTGVIVNARQGQSTMQVQGSLTDIVAAELKKRGFAVEEHEGTEGKFTYILWT